MAKDDDIRLLTEQEKALVLTGFDESVAFKIGSALRDRGLREGLAMVVDVRTWGRPIFFAALPGTTGDNSHWVLRKSNLVQRIMKSSYRMALEWGERERSSFATIFGIDSGEYALAGGSFPINVRGAGVIGAVTVSGLHERDDHGIVVDALADHLGLDKAALALPPL
ncbi:MAG: heme-degrading domain-containing protein [Devosia sp.]